MNNLDKAYEIVKQQGPVLPVEVASKLGVDSFLASAYLSQLVEAKKIRVTKERVGNAFLYFLPGQEVVANARVAALLHIGKKTARMFAEKVPESPEIEQKRRAFTERLQEIEKKESLQKTQPKLEVQKPTFTERIKHEFLDKLKPAISEQLARQEISDEKKLAQQAIQTAQQKMIEKKIEEGRLVEKVLAFLVDAHADIIGKELKKKGRDANIIVSIPTPIGNVRFLVLARDKKTISEADLSLAFTEGQSEKLPVLFVTNGKLTKTAQNYLQVISGLLKFKQID